MYQTIRDWPFRICLIAHWSSQRSDKPPCISRERVYTLLHISQISYIRNFTAAYRTLWLCFELGKNYTNGKKWASISTTYNRLDRYQQGRRDWKGHCLRLHCPSLDENWKTQLFHLRSLLKSLFWHVSSVRVKVNWARYYVWKLKKTIFYALYFFGQLWLGDTVVFVGWNENLFSNFSWKKFLYQRCYRTGRVTLSH